MTTREERPKARGPLGHRSPGDCLRGGRDGTPVFEGTIAQHGATARD
jgi:hypothetical protein